MAEAPLHSLRSWVAAAALPFLLACATVPAADRPVTPPEAASDSTAAVSAGAPASAGEQIVAAAELVPFELTPEGELPQAPADGRWAIDAEGNQYFVVRVPKREGGYVMDGEDRVRLHFGLPLALAGHDESYFYAKVFKPDPTFRTPVRRRAPTAGELAAIDASYQFELPEAGPLPLVPFDSGLPQRGQWRNGFTLADMNGDQHLDIVHGSPRKGFSGPVIFLGDGGGRWQPWAAARFPADVAYDYGDATVADFDRDGHLDVALAMHIRGLVVLHGDGQGGFRRGGEGLDYRAEGTGFSSRAAAALDFDGDGWTDLVALGEGMALRTSSDAPGLDASGLAFYRNRGDGSWERLPVALAAGVHGDDLTVADFDGDGRPDLAIAASVVGYRDLLFLNRGAEGWQPSTVEVRPGAFTRAVAAGDLDGDGRADLVVGYVSQEGGKARSGVDVFLNRAGTDHALGWERRPLAVFEGRQGFTALAIGELDGGGALDVAALTGDGELHLFAGRAGGQFARLGTPPVLPAVRGCSGFTLVAADLDGDGRQELVGGFAGEEASETHLRRVLAMETRGQRPCPGEGALTAWKPMPTGRAGEGR